MRVVIRTFSQPRRGPRCCISQSKISVQEDKTPFYIYIYIYISIYISSNQGGNQCVYSTIFILNILTQSVPSWLPQNNNTTCAWLCFSSWQLVLLKPCLALSKMRCMSDMSSGQLIMDMYIRTLLRRSNVTRYSRKMQHTQNLSTMLQTSLTS